MKKIVMFCGNSAVGKTAVITKLIPIFKRNNIKISVCKIDCLDTDDDKIYSLFNIPFVLGLSNDICPDHFLVSNMPELWNWSDNNESEILIIETAGLCNRCSPATQKTISICVVDCTASSHSPQKLGPMLTQSDMIILTKIDMISQAEKEILVHSIKNLNKNAIIFPMDALSGYGANFLANSIIDSDGVNTYENDVLRHSMPSGVCSYCIGECRVGNDFQQGVVGKINFEVKA